MLAVAHRRFGDQVGLINGSAEALPLASESFDHLTVTHVLRYVADPGATLAELARVVRPGGVVASLEFGVPQGLARPLWEPVCPNGAAARRPPAPAGLAGGRRLPGRVDPRLLGAPPARAPAPVVARGGPPRGRGAAVEPRHRRRHLGTEAVSPPDRAAEGGITGRFRRSPSCLVRVGARRLAGLRDAAPSSLHGLASVVRRHRRLPGARRRLGTARPVGAWGRLGAAVAAFALAVGVGAHALDELNGRPLRTRIPDRVLVGLASVSILGACAIGVAGAVTFEAWLALLIPIGVFLVLAYNLELAGGRFHSDVWFGLAWGGFPVLYGYAAVGGRRPSRHRARRGLCGAALARPARALEPRAVRATSGDRGSR